MQKNEQKTSKKREKNEQKRAKNDPTNITSLPQGL